MSIIKWKIGIICAGYREVDSFLPHLQNCHISEKTMLKTYEGNRWSICCYTLPIVQKVPWTSCMMLRLVVINGKN